MTMLSTTYPLSRVEETQHATTDTAPRPWGFWATLGWFGIAVAVYLGAGFVCGLGYVIWSELAHPGVPISFDAPVLDNLTVAISMPAAALVLIMAARRAGPSIFSYLGLVLPQRRHVLIGFGLMAAYW